MQPAPDILLRDIHQPAAPSLWPPAPGWWIVMTLVLLAGLAIAWWLRRRRLHRLAIERLFDDAMAEAGDGPAQVAAMSALLRRAARRHRDDADQLDGDAWLEALDENTDLSLFRSGIGRMLVEGAWQREVAPADIDTLRGIARTRFLQWMGVAK